MKKAQLLSVVFSLIMFTGVTAGTAVSYAESDDNDHDFDDKLEDFCEMTEVDQAAFLEKYPMASDHKDKLDEYCLLDESEREAYIEEHKDEYSRGHDYDIKTKLDKFCEMSTDELAALAEEHGFCSLFFQYTDSVRAVWGINFLFYFFRCRHAAGLGFTKIYHCNGVVSAAGNSIFCNGRFGYELLWHQYQAHANG